MSGAIENLRISDGNLIISAIEGLMDEPENQDSVAQAREMEEIGVGFGEPNRGLQVYEVYGETTPAKSPVMLRVFGTNQTALNTYYFLRGEELKDEPRIRVVRRALGLESS